MTRRPSGLRRLLRIVRVASRHLAAHLLFWVLARFPSVARRLRLEGMSGPVRLRMALEELGGSFIKLGQMLALQPDILSLEYCNALFTLLDRVAPFDYAEVERIFREELGRSPDELFDAFDRRALATASVGQVHVAVMHGRKVAVKVQRPDVERSFAGDLRLISAAMTGIRRARLSGLYWLLEPLGEFVAWTNEELDYRIEARYMERLRRNAEGRGTERIPEVDWRYTTRRTLVAEFLEGFTVLAWLRARHDPDGPTACRVAESGIDPYMVARNIIDNFLGSVFRHGMFHADLHPANLMVLRGNVIGYIDFGITGVISAYSRRNLVALTLAYTSGDLDGMADAFFRVCRMTDEGSPRGFRRGLNQLASSWYEQRAGRCALRKNFTLVMLDMLRLSRRCGVWPDRDVIKYIRSAIAIDGLITRMAPAFDISHYLGSVCAQHLRWQMRRTLLTADTLVDAASAASRMIRDGFGRGSAALGRFADSETGARLALEHDRPPAEECWSRGALMLGTIATIAAIVGCRAGDATLGANVYTAALLVVGLSSVKLARRFRLVAALSRDPAG